MSGRAFRIEIHTDDDPNRTLTAHEPNGTGAQQMKTAIALVDYDNAVRGTRELKAADAALNLEQLVRRLLSCPAFPTSTVDTLHIRLYGGWLLATKQPTTRAVWLNTAIPRLARKRDGVAVRVQLAETLQLPFRIKLYGTYVPGNPTKQKMVDSMLALDYVTFSRTPSTILMLATDDADLLPATLSAAIQRDGQTDVLWLRNSPALANDTDATNHGLQVTAW